MKLTESQLKQIVKEEISKTLNEVNLPFWFVKVGQDNMRVPKEQAENAVQALELAILDRLNHPEISDKMKKRIVDFVDDSYTVVDLSTGDKHENIEVSDSFLETNEDLLDKYSPMLEGRNNMKLTESQLRKIIREELEAVREVDDLSRARAAARDESRELRGMLVKTPKNPDGYEMSFLRSMLPVGDKQPPAVALANLGLRVSRGKMTLDDAKAKFMEMYPQPINEEKTDPIPLRMIFLDDEVNAAIAAGRSSRAARKIPDPSPQRIRTRLNAMLGKKSGEGIASYQGTSGSPKRKLMIRAAIQAYENEYTRRKRR